MSIGEMPAETLAWIDRLVVGLVRRHRIPPCFELDDLRQIAAAAAWRQMREYSAAHASGAPLHGYLYPYVRGAVLMSIRRRAWTESVAHELPADVAAEQDYELAVAAQDGKDELLASVREACQALPIEDLTMLRDWLDGRARRDRETTERVDRVMVWLRERLAERGVRRRSDLAR